MNNNFCLFCKAENIKLITSKDYNRATNKLNFNFCYCYNCKSISNLSKLNDLSIYYKNDLSPFDISDDRYNRITKKNKYYLNLIKKFIKTGKVLELGPGFGYLSKLLVDEKSLLTIIEQDSELCYFYRKKLKIKDIKEADIVSLKLDQHSYNAIIAFQVIEHLNDPNIWMQNISNSLDNKGLLFLSTPNPNSLQFKIMNSLWPHLDAPRHQIIYSPKSLEKLLNNYKLIKIHESWGIDTILWNFFGWNNFFRIILKNKKNNFITRFLGFLFFIIFLPIEVLPGFGASYIHVYKKTY